MMMSAVLEQPRPLTQQPALAWKLWLYTNYDCNLTCTYCVARSGPGADVRAGFERRERGDAAECGRYRQRCG
jgi:hypothetical protein